MLVALLSLVLAQAESSAVPPSCAYDREAVLALSVKAFDQDPTTGWRPLAGRAGCDAAAADLIAAYRRANLVAMDEGEIHISYWHEGQLRASADQTGRAIPLMLAGVNPDSVTGFTDYALGTVAFLNRDRPGLEAARARLAALPAPADWPEMVKAYQALGVTPAWPPNLDILDGLIVCWDQPYSQAYGDCDAAAATQPKGLPRD